MSTNTNDINEGDAIVIDLDPDKLGTEQPVKKDWRDFPNRERNTMVIALTEGDVLVDGDVFKHVSEGEVYVYADGTIDESKGELAEVSIDGVQDAMTTGKQIFNMEEVG